MEIGRGKNRMKRKELIQGWHMQRARLRVQGREIERLKHEQEMTKLTCDTVQEKYEGEKIRVERLKKENERLRTEKEWLLKQYATELYDMHENFRKKYNIDSIKQRVVLEMLQLLKKG